MSCMKCGRDLEEGQVFCIDCLKDMSRYPVKPGIAVQLPKHREQHAPKKVLVKRRSLSPEEQLLRLKKRLKAMFTLWLVTLLLLALTIYPTIQFVKDLTGTQLGQNYSTITDSNPTEP